MFSLPKTRFFHSDFAGRVRSYFLPFCGEHSWRAIFHKELFEIWVELLIGGGGGGGGDGGREGGRREGGRGREGEGWGKGARGEGRG